MVHCSVIIPHYNQSEYLSKCLEALINQEAEGINYEIIVVDNGTKDLTIPDDPKIRLLKNTTALNPYTSRNMGIQASTGHTLAFLDAKCTASSGWLKNGLNKLEFCDIAAGRYEVKINSKIQSKVFPLLYLNSAKNVEKGYGISSGNMFLKKKVFDHLGSFDTYSNSGNDILFTKKAMIRGFTIGLAEKAVVYYPSKSFQSLINDMRKYGRGAAMTHQKSLLSIFSYILPMRWSTLKQAMSYRKYNFSVKEIVKVWFLIWRAKLEFAIGILDGYRSTLTFVRPPGS